MHLMQYMSQLLDRDLGGEAFPLLFSELHALSLRRSGDCASFVQSDAEDVIGPLSDKETAEKLRQALLLHRRAAALYAAVPLDLPSDLEVRQRSPLFQALQLCL